MAFFIDDLALVALLRLGDELKLRVEARAVREQRFPGEQLAAGAPASSSPRGA